MQHYYKGIKLATIPIEVHSNNKVLERLFYTEKEEAKVYIENPDKIQKLRITVNGKEIDVKLKDDITKVEISKYLLCGENKISYVILDEDIDYSKKVKVFTEVKEAECE